MSNKSITSPYQKSNQAECGRCPGREKLARVFISTLHQKKLDFTLTNELVSNVKESFKV